jgi:sialate O-acetylesterase
MRLPTLQTALRITAMSAAAAVLIATDARAQNTPVVRDTAGEVRLARLFSNGVVLQRGVGIPVWGWAAPRTPIVVTLAGRSARATADTAGRWSVRLPALPAGGPHTIVVHAAGAHATVSDVLIGDVWVASGQSNMEWRLADATGGREAAAAARDSLLREFKVPISWSEAPAADLTGGSWAPADAQHAGNMSAVAYYFARELRDSQRVPVGIVNTSWGGSAIETWLSAGASELPPDAGQRELAAERTRLDAARSALVARFGDLRKDPGMTDGAAPWAAAALDTAGWTRLRTPALWESQGYADVDGIAWYRTTVNLSAAQAARGAQLVLGPIDDDDVTWVNGVEVGRTRGYNLPRRYVVPASALREGPNAIAVRVADYGGGGGIYGSGDSLRFEVGDGSVRPLSGEWRFRLAELGMQMDGQRTNKVPVITYNQMVHPLLGFPIKGVIWYQGESNANSDEQARAYRDQLRTLVTSWRREWKGSSATFPFFWVQLPNYGQADPSPSASGGAWAVHREATTAVLSLPNTGQAVTIDVGDPNDIHPRDKAPVGHRLALLARKVAYGENVRTSGPTYLSHVVQGDRVTVRFANVGTGLVARGGIDGGAANSGFQVAGADRRWAWANVRMERDRVVVWSDQVPHPVAVRYAWSGNPAATLFNSDMLPAAPFRTDAW